MGKLLFVDSSFHNKTKSTNFLLDLLGEHFEVEIFYIEDASVEEIKRKAKDDFEAVLFLQINPAYYINYFNGANVVFVPMYDTFSISKRRHLLFLKRIKWICFSEKYRPYLKGVDSLFVKYYPKPKEQIAEAKPNTFFFWQRRAEINWNVLKRLLGETQVDGLNIHTACDPGVAFIEPSEDDRTKYRISFTSWFASKEALDDCLAHYTYYFAPRGKEGIGLSFLDAMASGLVVIAPNDATMNEYITDGINGYLYDLDNPTPIEFADYEEVKRRSRAGAISGNEAWESNKGKIIAFIKKKHKRNCYPINKSGLLGAKEKIRFWLSAMKPST